MMVDITRNITLVGVLCLGAFVGFILATTVNLQNEVRLKIAVALIGAALSGAPILFMDGLTYEKWMYPIGLIMGFVWIRVIGARTSKIFYGRQPKKGARLEYLLAWLDTIAIALATIVTIITVAFFA